MNIQKPEPFEFEKGMQRLEEIIQQFDDGALSLDEMENRFIEGMELIDQCGKRLESVDARVTQLIRTQKDKWSEIPMDPVDDNSEE